MALLSSSNNQNPFSDITMPGTTSQGPRIQHNVGKIILQINTEILELLEELKKVKLGQTLSQRGVDLKELMKVKKESLEEVLDTILSNDTDGKLEKTKKDANKEKHRHC